MSEKLLSGPQRKFCAGYAVSLNATEAYLAAYPKSSAEAARRGGSRLLTNADIAAEIARLRAEAESQPGSAVLTLAEKRNFVARLVRADLMAPSEVDGDLVQEIAPTEFGRKIKLGDKLRAIQLDNDLAGEGSEAKGNEALAGLMGRLRSKTAGSLAIGNDKLTRDAGAQNL